MKTQEELEKEKADFKASLEGLSEEEKAQKLEEKEKAEELLKHNTEIEEELRIEREKREEAERKLEETRVKSREAFEERERKRKEGEQPEPLTEGAVRIMLEEHEEKIRKDTRAEQALEIAKRLSPESESEANLTLEIWKNRKLPGTLQEQMEEAHAIATNRRTKAQNEELKRALLGKEGETDVLNAQRKPMLGSEPKLDPNDKTVLKGRIWDPARGAYKKIIAGGKKMLYTSRDLKKSWVEDIK